MKITQRELNRYRNQISQRKSDASAYLRARMTKETKGLSVANARNKTIEIMQDCLAVFGDQAQALSAEFFDEICEAEGLDAVSQIFDDVIDEEKMTEKVRYYAGKLKDGDWDGYAGSAADLAAYYVHKSALENLFRNCDLNNIRFARVGTGRETCGFCFMLCSRGFVYASESTAANASHPHCDCIIVPGQKGRTRIEGYEPEKMQERWAACWDTLGGDKQLRQDWESLTDAEKAKCKGKKEHEKWLNYRNKRIQRECEIRSNEWLYRGRTPKQAEKERGAKPFPKELKTDKLLRQFGIKSRFRNPSGKEGRTSDVFFLGGSSKAPTMDKWEFKCPDGNSKKAIKNQLKKAAGMHGKTAQSNKVVISNTNSSITFSEMCNQLEALDGRFPEIHEVIIVSEDKQIRHYIRKAQRVTLN